ncbi:NlpC/P60 family protein [Streptomyces sp. NBC_01340]|uniref:C40 family peptidase n=1 Tax=Streptomyces sp. NBC_01340 TaxID=2903830 RepID=UPI002E0DA399|nr:NlpC/P60 family protein [Streptomyces sp. NBC_01340]
MSGRLLRLACTAAMATGVLSAAPPAVAVPDPGPQGRPVAQLLTDLQRLYRDAERATETYNATADQLKKQKTEVARLDKNLAEARLSLNDNRAAAGRLARQQYQNSGEISSYVRLLLARDPQHALDEGHVIGQLARQRVETVKRLAGTEKRADGLAREARKALDGQLGLAERQKRERDEVRGRLRGAEELVASLSTDQLAELARLEKPGASTTQRELVTSGALSSARPPSRAGEEAVRYAVDQLGKPYEWGAVGPSSYDCSGLTSQAWDHAGRPIPRTSQEQWAQLPRVPLSKLRPGDLIIYFPKATHVALYVGDGLVVQAPRPGTKIKVSPLAANPLLGAVRPDPDGTPLRRYTPPSIGEGSKASVPSGVRGTVRSAAESPHPK